MPDPEPVLLVPGTQTTTLIDTHGKSVYNAVSSGFPLIPKSFGGRPKEQWMTVMGMDHASGQIAPVRTCLEPGGQLQAGTVILTPYELFPKYYEEWPYDWRADLRWNSERLLAEIRARAKPKGPRLNIVAHSQGGLLTILASKFARPGEFAELVSRVILVGTPFAGTMRAVEALVFGSPSFGKENVDISLALGRNWPATYQMLPAWDCVTDAQGNPLPRDQQLTERGGWPAGTDVGITDDMLERARAVQALLRNPFENFGPGIAVTTILGQNQTTGVRLIREDDQFLRMESEKSNGDDLVPFKQTLQWGGNAFTFTVVPFAGQTRKHAELCTDPTIAALVINRVNAPAPFLPTVPVPI